MIAAARKAHEIAALALDEDAVARLLALTAPRRFELREELRYLGGRLRLHGFAVQLDQLRHDPLQGDAAVAERCEQIVLGLHVELLRDDADTPVRK